METLSLLPDVTQAMPPVDMSRLAIDPTKLQAGPGLTPPDPANVNTAILPTTPDTGPPTQILPPGGNVPNNPGNIGNVPPRRSRLGSWALTGVLGVGLWKGFDLSPFSGIKEQLGSPLTGVAETLVISSSVAFTGLRGHIARMRTGLTEQSYKNVESAVARQIESFDALDTSRQRVEGKKPVVLGQRGIVLPRRHPKQVRKMVNARDKSQAERLENLGPQRHMARRQVGGTVRHEMYPGYWVTLPTNEPGLGSETHLSDLKANPRTKKELNAHEKAIAEHRHIQHTAEGLWEHGVETTVGGEREILEDLTKKQDRLAERVQARRDHQDKIANRQDRRSRTYDISAQKIRGAGRAVKRLALRRRRTNPNP